MQKGTKIFNQLYSKLNKAQRQAVDAIEGPVMVLAGPGTGKTHILTLRIANILCKTDVEPENILALTFTDAGANNMRRRLAQIVGSVAYRVNINTFHSFCNGIIHDFAESFPRVIGSRDITDIDQIKIINDLIDTLPLKSLRPFGSPYHYTRAIRSAIGDLKKDNIDDKDFKKIVAREADGLKKAAFKKLSKTKQEAQKRNYQKNKELSLVFSAYQEVLKKKEWYDYNDMILEVVRALEKDKNLKFSLQEQYLYMLADEHQDANHAQNRVLELIADYHQSPNLFIVGDDKQAIYRFQGASLENFLYFKKRYPGLALIDLDTSYRSGQNILDGASSVIVNTQGGLASEGTLKSSLDKKGEKIFLGNFSSPDVEHYFLASDIKKKIKGGVSPSEIAIIYRDNKDAFPVAAMLEKEGVPFVVESNQNLLEDNEIRKLVGVFRAVVNFGDSKYLVDLLHIDFLGLDPLRVYKLVAEGGNLYDAMASDKYFKNIYNKLSYWHKKSKNSLLLESFEHIVKESGFLSSALSGKNIFADMSALSVFFGEAQILVEKNSLSSLKSFVGHIDMLLKYNLSLSRRLSGGADHIHLVTAHRAKGREFEYVYLTGVYRGRWGARRVARHFNLTGSEQEKVHKEDDERRLFYVALTRAKKVAYITHPTKTNDGKEKIASQFISEIAPNYLDTLDIGAYESNFINNQQVIFAPRRKTSPAIHETETIKEIFSRRGFSVTALNNYLVCPWRYFYRNLLRVPGSREAHQMFGSAIHESLAEFFNNLKKGGELNKVVLLSLFKDKMARFPFKGVERKAWLKRGDDALSGFYKEHSPQWGSNALVELRLNTQFSKDVRLTGIVDKLEFLNDKGLVNVADYKTGRVKSRNEILGNTQNSDGGIWRQIVFYKLLLEGAMKGKYSFSMGEIIFVEPNKSGIYKKERFEVSEADVKELKDKITGVTGEILSLGFWDKRCEDKECEFCALRNMMV